jgi:hypothetical protein
MRRSLLVSIAAAVLLGALVCSTAPALTGSPFAAHARSVPASTASASAGGLLFDGVHIRDFANIEAAPHAITEVADPLGGGRTVLKMVVNDNDVAPVTPTDNPRAQALSPNLIHEGNEFWLETEFMIPESFPSQVPGWLSLVSIYGPPYDGSSPWQVGLDGRDMSWERNEHYGYDTPWKQPLPRNKWVRVLLHERFDEHGWVEMWIDGQPITFFARGASSNRNHLPPTRRIHMATVDWSNDGGANAAKIMQYREEGMFDTATVYFGALKVGTSRAAVTG